MLRVENIEEPLCLPLQVIEEPEIVSELAQYITNQFLSAEEVKVREDESGLCPQRLSLHRKGLVALTGEEQVLLNFALLGRREIRYDA